MLNKGPLPQFPKMKLNTTRWLTLIFTLLVISAACLLLFSYLESIFLYATNVVLFDHGEALVTSLSLSFSQGGEIWHTQDSFHRHSVPYGPVIFYLQGAAMRLFKASQPILVSKLMGASYALAALLLFSFSIYKELSLKLDRTVSILITSLAISFYTSAMLSAKHFSFWNRGDSLVLLIVCASLALRSFFSSKNTKYPSLVLLAVFAGVILNVKINAIVFLAPILYESLRSRTKSEIMFFGLVVIFISVLPFLKSNVSINNYIWTLAHLKKHFSFSVFRGNFGFLKDSVGYFAIGVMFCSQNLKNSVTKNVQLGIVLILTLLCVLAIASVHGSGLPSLIPIVPVLLYYVCCLPDFRNFSISSPKSFLAKILPQLGWLIVIFSFYPSWKNAFAFRDSIQSISRKSEHYKSILVDLNSVKAKYLDRKCQMGLGAEEGYELTFYKTELRRGETKSLYFFDGAGVMQFQYAGFPLSKELESRLFQCGLGEIWLIPKGQRPFTMSNWYDGTELFSAGFRELFNSKFKKIDHSHFYDIYECSQRHG